VHLATEKRVRREREREREEGRKAGNKTLSSGGS
jgi:hypothetical protein